MKLIFLFLASMSFFAVGAACTSPRPSLEEANRKQGLDRFKTAVAVAKDAGYTPYWLGTEFEAGGLIFVGPSTTEQRVTSAGMYTQATYGDAPGRDFALYVQSLSNEAWTQNKEGIEYPGGEEPLVKSVQVAGRDATLYAIGATLQIVVRLDRAVVVVIVRGSALPAPVGSRPNPLSDEPTLLALLENLRPYPE